ncbi:unnamed protein product [Prunus armeniaca]
MHAKKKNGWSSVALSVDDSLTVLSQLSILEHADYEGNQGKTLLLFDQRDTRWIINSGAIDDM